jgi:hypothetical protein
MSFSTISVRANGQKILYSWFNALRTAGMALESFLGGGYVSETSFTIANNQSSPADVTGLLFNKDSYTSVHVYAEIRRKTNSNEAVSTGVLKLIWMAATSTWEILDELGGPVDDGVTFTITASGQVQYASDNMAGTGYVGTMKFKAITFAA